MSLWNPKLASQKYRALAEVLRSDCEVAIPDCELAWMLDYESECPSDPLVTQNRDLESLILDATARIEVQAAAVATMVRTQTSLCRPGMIVKTYLQRCRKKRRWTWSSTIQWFADTTSISSSELVEIIEGRLPTAYLIDLLCKSMKWTHGFLLGYNEETYAAVENVFFHEMGEESPSVEERRAFRQFFMEIRLEYLDDITRRAS